MICITQCIVNHIPSSRESCLFLLTMLGRAFSHASMEFQDVHKFVHRSRLHGHLGHSCDRACWPCILYTVLSSIYCWVKGKMCTWSNARQLTHVVVKRSRAFLQCIQMVRQKIWLKISWSGHWYDLGVYDGDIRLIQFSIVTHSCVGSLQSPSASFPLRSTQVNLIIVEIVTYVSPPTHFHGVYHWELITDMWE